MSASSDSNDGSDLFWPGYVDAVTNLAINLLFVIAVMSIVVLSSILQISKMKPDIPSKDPDAVKAKTMSSKDETNESNKSTAPSESSPFKNKSEAGDIDKIENEKKLIDKKIVSQAELIAKLEKEINQLRTGQALQKNSLEFAVDCRWNSRIGHLEYPRFYSSTWPRLCRHDHADVHFGYQQID